MKRLPIRPFLPALLLGAGLFLGGDVEAAPFPEGIEGELYYCPRIDLVPAEDGGPLAIDLDGELGDEAWARAAWQGWAYAFEMPRGGAGVSEDEDFDLEWAAVADTEFLYVAWRATDDVLRELEDIQCDVWKDDSIEVYIDAENDGPDCTATGDRCYGLDDQQITVGVDNIGLDPEELVIGGVGPGANCDFFGPTPEVAQGVVMEMVDPDGGGVIGWQAEIAIPLETMGNGDDGTPTWLIEPDHGHVIGWNVQGNDDDDGGGRDHKLTWSVIEVSESAWRNPGVFGKLMFVDPTQEPPPLYRPVLDLACARNPDGTVSLTWRNPEGADPGVRTRIRADGAEVSTVAGSAEEAELTADEVPDDRQDHAIEVINSSDIAAECVLLGSPFDACGAIRTWNILGAFDNASGAAPPVAVMAEDYMTDGETGETDFVWEPGATIDTDFGGAAASNAIDGGPAGRNPDGTPTVFARSGASGRVNFQAPEAFGGDLNYVMAYAQAYVIAEEEEEVFLGISSDDSVQVLLNGEQVWINSVPRPASDPCTPQDFPPDPVLLREGYNSLIVKIFEGEGDWEFAVRIQDDLGQPFTEGLDIILTFPPMGTLFRRGDGNGDGRLDIGDAVRILNHLFAAGPMDCDDAADVNDDGRLDIGDPIRLLNFMFASGPAPADPFGDCGLDPSDDPLGCEAYPGC